MSNFKDFIKPINKGLAPKNIISRKNQSRGSVRNTANDWEDQAIRGFELLVVFGFLLLLTCSLLFAAFSNFYVIEGLEIKPYKEGKKYQLKMDYEAYRQKGIQKSQDKLRELGLHDYITP